MQTDLGELVLQHLEEHRQQVVDRPARRQLASPISSPQQALLTLACLG